ncbi:1909_t:CDS:2, partial [Cetraspora pellucida]
IGMPVTTVPGPLLSRLLICNSIKPDILALALNICLRPLKAKSPLILDQSNSKNHMRSDKKNLNYALTSERRAEEQKQQVIKLGETAKHKLPSPLKLNILREERRFYLNSLMALIQPYVVTSKYNWIVVSVTGFVNFIRIKLTVEFKQNLFEYVVGKKH